MLANELLEFCSSESLSEEGLREIIERHGLTPNNNHEDNYTFFLWACSNGRFTEGIIRLLLEYFPAAAGATDEYGNTPLHAACYNNNSTTRGIIQLLIDAAPDSIRSVDSEGMMPLHWLCEDKGLDESVSLEILQLLIEKHPQALRHADYDGCLPIHMAASTTKSPEFCRFLIEGYPGSERISDDDGWLPFHGACQRNTVETVEYLYKLYPDAINHETNFGMYPIHHVLKEVVTTRRKSDSVDVAAFLLDCNPCVKLQKFRGQSLLDFACRDVSSNVDAALHLQIVEVIYDAYPEAIESQVQMQRCKQRVQSFIRNQLVYARQARDHRLMTTPDDNGRLPLHTALRDNVTLGTIKLFVKGNPLALQSPDNSGALPLHIACQNYDSTSVIRYLVGHDTSTLDAVDLEGNTALHYACRGAKYETIAMLLEKYDAVSVSKRNAHMKLPIDLLFESNEAIDRESGEYTESVFRLLSAYPEAIMNYNVKQQPVSTAGRSPQKRKKRKASAL